MPGSVYSPKNRFLKYETCGEVDFGEIERKMGESRGAFWIIHLLRSRYDSSSLFYVLGSMLYISSCRHDVV